MSQEGGCITKVRRARKPIATADPLTRLILDQSGAPSMIRQPSGYAPVAESVDAVDSKSASGNGVPVRVGPGAPQNGRSVASPCRQQWRAASCRGPLIRASRPKGTARHYVIPARPKAYPSTGHLPCPVCAAATVSSWYHVTPYVVCEDCCRNIQAPEIRHLRHPTPPVSRFRCARRH